MRAVGTRKGVGCRGECGEWDGMCEEGKGMVEG